VTPLDFTTICPYKNVSNIFLKAVDGPYIFHMWHNKHCKIK
jgi:hypothetical protein